jgi:nicotinate-nucleotide adenylyltransferase
MQIGIFGGTFNPIHRCHLLVAEEIRQRMSLDLILFIPAGEPPHKEGEEILAARHRLEMMRLAIQSHKGFLVSDLEVTRPGKSYTVETVETLSSTLYRGDELFFIIGLDAFLEVATWKGASRLLSLCHFIVISRKGFLFKDLTKIPLLPPLNPEPLHQLDRSEIARLVIPLPSEKRLHLLIVPHCEASSTQIRLLLSHGKGAKNLLPLPVESYIIQHKLYHTLEAKR